MISIENIIAEKRYTWTAKYGEDPDTILVSIGTYYKFISCLRSTASMYNTISPGKFKYMGMDIIYSPLIEDDDVRVSKTKLP